MESILFERLKKFIEVNSQDGFYRFVVSRASTNTIFPNVPLFWIDSEVSPRSLDHLAREIHVSFGIRISHADPNGEFLFVCGISRHDEL